MCKLKNTEGLKEFFEQSMGINLTPQEYKLFVSALSNEHGGSKSIIDGSKAMKSLLLLLDEIHLYGHFQQLIFILGKCLSSEPSSRPTFADIRAFAIFNITEEISLLKASDDAKLIMVPYKNPMAFCNEVIFAPLSTCVDALIKYNNSKNDELDIHVKAFTKVLAIIEELLVFHCDHASLRGTTEISQVLQDVGLDVSWLNTYICEVVKSFSTEGALQAVALFVLKASTLDIPVKKSASPTRKRTLV